MGVGSSHQVARMCGSVLAAIITISRTVIFYMYRIPDRM